MSLNSYYYFEIFNENLINNRNIKQINFLWTLIFLLLGFSIFLKILLNFHINTRLGFMHHLKVNNFPAWDFNLRVQCSSLDFTFCL